jgi:hypothetical protein
MCFSCPFTNFSCSLSCRLTPVVVRLGSVFAAWTEKETSAYSSSPPFSVYRFLSLLRLACHVMPKNIPQ